ncbi:MAG: ABC transporter permease [Desulfobacterales bacterium]|jgi:ABC-2 type transport system permease protein
MLRTRLQALMAKEFLNILRDPKARAVLIGPPVVQIFIFSFAMTMEAKNIHLGVLNLDHGRSGIELVARFREARTFTRIVALRGQPQIQSVLDEQRVLAVLVVPVDFSRRIGAGAPATVQLLLDGRKTNTAQIVAGYCGRILERFAVDRDRGTDVRPAILMTRHWFNPNLEFMWYTVPSLICILSTVIGLILTSLTVAREREMGTFEQLLVSPLQPLEILAGKALPALFLALGSASLLLTIAIFIFRIPFQGSLPLLFGALIIFLLAIIGIGLFISSLSMTQQQAILGAFIFMPPAVILSGFATPIANMPVWLQNVTVVNPLRWFLIIVRGIFLKDMPPAVVLANIYPMVLIALATLAAATWLFKRRMA